MKNTLIVIGVCLIAAAINLSAENRRHDLIMGDVNATFAALRKDIDSGMSSEARQDAAKLSGLFKEVELFWAPLRSKSAVDAARNVQTAAENIAESAKANDLKRADALYGGIGKSCKACHERHRLQMPVNSYKIRP